LKNLKLEFGLSLFIFRRDLRVEDNTALISALKSSKLVIPAFIFTPEQIEKNSFRSDHCLKFMLESLEDLDGQLRKKGGHLYYFEGKVEEILSQSISKLKIEAVFVNRDYTPYSRERDKKIERMCEKSDIPFFSFDDALLHPPEETLKKDGKPYTVFTPYFRNASLEKVLPPVGNSHTNYFHGTISFSSKMIPKPKVENDLIGGRSEALKILKKLSAFAEYGVNRDFPAEEYSTHLSAYLKFTVCSPREVYAAILHHLGKHHELIRALYWRDFFTGIAFFFPHVFEGAFHSKFDKLKWSDDKKAFKRWCEGTTGFPIVDAGMREMNETGFMHNRVRMIAASFLVKDLHIDWRWGERYFAQTLIDYDPAVNNGNWQWVASTGCDAQPYFRIFNPWRQQKRFDPDCIYIKKWIPELRNVDASEIHKWEGDLTYPCPMVDHEKASKKILAAYKAIK